MGDLDLKWEQGSPNVHRMSVCGLFRVEVFGSEEDGFSVWIGDDRPCQRRPAGTPLAEVKEQAVALALELVRNAEHLLRFHVPGEAK